MSRHIYLVLGLALIVLGFLWAVLIGYEHSKYVPWFKQYGLLDAERIAWLESKGVPKGSASMKPLMERLLNDNETHEELQSRLEMRDGFWMYLEINLHASDTPLVPILTFRSIRETVASGSAKEWGVFLPGMAQVVAALGLGLFFIRRAQRSIS